MSGPTMLLSVALSAVAAALLLPCVYLLVQVAMAARTVRSPHLEPAMPQRRMTDAGEIAVLVPAHNESSQIAATIHAIQPQLRPQDRLLVVADNCTDDTAEIARRCGALVTERTDATRRGKGFALDHGFQQLSPRPPACVVMVDADCHVEPQALARLAHEALATGRPVQASYLMLPADRPALGERIATFAWRVKNHVRPLGARALGLPCLLTGSGMAFPWSVLQGAPLASGNIVEDMQLGIDLACRGHLPLFLPEAVVTSRFAERSEAQAGQRRRWEHGHIATLLSQTPRLIAGARRLRQPRLLGLAAELAVPPLALFVLALLASLVAGAAWMFVSGAWLPLAITVSALAAFGVAIVWAWRLAGTDLLSAGDLLGAPAYVWRKLPIYLSFLRQRESAWVRTERDRDEPR